MSTRVSAILLCISWLLQGCGESTPPCHFKGRAAYAPSAGCLVLQDKKLLLVETMGVRYGPPGGSANKGENAQCAAERETFEESGVEVVARQLEHRFDNGFHLFWCDPVGSTDIAISRPIEVFGARWFAVNELRNLSWRYPEQDLLIENSVRRKMGLPQIRSHLDPIQ